VWGAGERVDDCPGGARGFLSCAALAAGARAELELTLLPILSGSPPPSQGCCSKASPFGAVISTTPTPTLLQVLLRDPMRVSRFKAPIPAWEERESFSLGYSRFMRYEAHIACS